MTVEGAFDGVRGNRRVGQRQRLAGLAGGEAIFGAAFPYIASVVVGLMNLIATMAALTVIDKLGRRRVFWATIVLMSAGLALTLFTALPLVVIGMLTFTFGFFGAHSVASSWIGRRAPKAKGQASSLYLFSYYIGSSVAGTLGGMFWHAAGWNGIGLFIGTLLMIALGVAIHLARLPVLPGNRNG